MAGAYEGQNLPESEFDPFQNVKASNFDNETSRGRNEQNSAQKQKSSHPFSRDFIDSLFTVVNKDLLYCKLFYFFFFGAFGSLFPLLAIYFKQLGMNASQSGVLIGFRPFIEFLSAPFWGGLADKWRRGKEMLLFSLLCWIVFTLAIAFVQPPAHKCITFDGTHHRLEAPIGRSRRGTNVDTMSLFDQIDHSVIESSRPDTFLVAQDKYNNIGEGNDMEMGNPALMNVRVDNSNIEHRPGSTSQSSEDSPSSTEHEFSPVIHGYNELPSIVLPKDLSPFYLQSRYRRSLKGVDKSKIANANETDIDRLVFNPHSAVVYEVSLCFCY